MFHYVFPPLTIGMSVVLVIWILQIAGITPGALGGGTKLILLPPGFA